MVDRKIQPEVKNPIDSHIALPDIEQRTLLSEVPLYIYNGGAQEVFRLDLSMPCGSWVQDHAMQALLTASLLGQGSTTKSSEEVARILDFYGASFDASFTSDYFTIRLQGMSKYMEQLMPLFKELILEPLFDQTDFDSLLQRIKQNFQINITKSDYVANREFEKMLFGADHPYGKYTHMEDFDRIKRKHVIEFYEDKFTMEGAKFFISGKFSAADLGRAEETLNHLILNKNKLPEWHFKPIPTKEKHQEITLKADALQAAIAVGRTLFDYMHEDYMPFIVLNTAFGGYFGSRLMSNIREDKGYTYGIYSRFVGFKHDTMMMITADINKSVSEDTLHQIRIEMSELMNHAMPEDELLVVKNYLFSGMMSSVDGAFKIMAKWKTYILNDFDKSRFEKQQDVIRNVSAEDLRKLAQKYYQEPDIYELVVG